jgi:crotonobetainyl-CoA:carnitine CoA-transferase CaiB-like acyl-CoA transferase
VLDHAAGYFLAAGIEAAVYRQAVEGGSWVVDVSLAGVMKYLRSLGQYEGRTGFEEGRDYTCLADVPEEYLETRQTGFGEITFVRHSASVEGVEVGWDVMPKPLGSDEKRWL